MSMKVTQSLRKPYRPKYPKHSAKWLEVRAARRERRAALVPQARSPLGFVVIKQKDGSTGLKPDSRRAHEIALMDKQLSDEINAASKKRRTKRKADA